MKRWLAVAVVAAMLAVPAVSAADWPQAGYDAARTGNPPDPGPSSNDTAFVAEIPGRPSFFGDFPFRPRIADGDAYVPIGFSSDEGTSGIARLNLDTANVEMLVETDRDPQGIAISDGTLFVLRTGGMDAYDLDTGERLWRLDHPQFAAQPVLTLCGEPAIQNGVVVAPCTEVDRTAATTIVTSNTPAAWYPFVWVVNAETGETVWTKQLDRAEAEDPSTMSRAPEDARPGEDGIRIALGLSIVTDRVLAVTIDQNFEGVGCGPVPNACTSASNQRTRLTLWGLHMEDGALEWWNSTEVVETKVQNDPVGPHNQALPATSFEPSGDAGVAFTKFDGKIQQINPAQGGDVLWEESLGQQDALGGLSGASSALTEDAVYVSSLQSVSKYSLAQPVPAIDWQFRLDSTQDQVVVTGSLIVSDGTVYLLGSSAHPGPRATVLAVNEASGDLAWSGEISLSDGEKREGPFFPFTYAVGDGVLLAVGEDGTVHAIGETEASLGAPTVDPDRYPDEGEEVTIDASDTEPGAFGEATRYMVDWGDGTSSGWQENPTFTHAYEDEGTYDARVYAGNDANQTNSNLVTMNVGQEEPNWLSERFEPGNQDMTFGVLGVALALGGGAIGVARRKRRKSLLQDELDALEQGFEETRETPSECEALLDNRKARARSLALDGKLEEQQVSIIEDRAEELRAELRVDALEDQFAFLPYGLVTKARQMVEDGKVTALERDAFLQAIEEDDVLTSQQKTDVRERIERWHGRDAGGPG